MTGKQGEQLVERITHAQAAGLLGCHPSFISKLVQRHAHFYIAKPAIAADVADVLEELADTLAEDEAPG